MTINLTIKANVGSLTLSEIYELLSKYSKEEKTGDSIYEFKGAKFKIESEVGLSINYVINELIKQP